MGEAKRKALAARQVAPDSARFASNAAGIGKGFECSGLETTMYTVASGTGVTVGPQLSARAEQQAHVRYVPFASPVPARRVVLAWRHPSPRYEATAALRKCIYACAPPGVTRLTS